MGWFKKFVSNPVSAIGDVVDKTVHEVSNATSSVDDFVNDEIPGGWATVALVAGGYYYQPEIQAWMAADGSVAATADQVAATNLGADATADQIIAAAVPEGSAYVAPTIGEGTNLAELANTGVVSDAGGGTALTDLANAPDAIDIGGGFNPATGSSAVPGAGADAIAADNIDVGGGWNPATGTGDAATANAAAATGTTASAAENYGATTVPGATISPGGTPTPSGTNLSSLLTPNNALIAKAILDAVGGDKVAGAISDAAATQQKAYEASKGDLSGLYTAQQGYQRPYMTTGANALGNINALSTGPYTQYDYQGNPIGTGTGSGYLQHQFDKNDLAAGLAPNYDFMLQQGQMANQRAANVAGGALGGNALQGLNKYTQDYAGNAYQNAFTNYQNQRNNIYNTLSNIAGIGQNATNTLAKTSDTYGTNLTNLNVGNAAAQAAAQVARAQTQGNTLSNLANTGVLASLLNQQPAVG
jgi:hypothetical protein